MLYYSLKLAQVVVERLDVGEDTHGVRFTTHDHHVVYLDEAVTTSLHLCGPKGQLKVVFAVGRGQSRVVELGGEEGVHQGTECHPVAPAGREVLDVDVLVSDGFGATPFKEDLFDAAGAGDPKTLRPLQFGFGVHWFGPTVVGFRLQPLEDRPTSLSADVTRQSLRPHQLPLPLYGLTKGSVSTDISISVMLQQSRVCHRLCRS